ncbi:MAG: adenylate/guanylate cyclase domain-containing protein [Chitinophagaceae bacterium]|nr:adenylate/guanylate cyclase domain-containing protein [Chitinophagaceae bacterium]
MKRSTKLIMRKIPVATRYRYKLIALIATGWLLLDMLYLLIRLNIPGISPDRDIISYSSFNTILLRAIIVFTVSGLMASVLFFQAHGKTIELPLGINFILKTIILILLAFLMNSLIYMMYSVFVLENSFTAALSKFAYRLTNTPWMLKKIPGWILTFLLLQVIVEMIKKYSPGIFFDVLLGKYRHPKVEKRIVMFIDLKDSTPIAEKLGNVDYFRFIRQFIELVSTALIQYQGRIYQYVGDEVVVSWQFNSKNARRAIDSLIETRKLIQKEGESFRRNFDITPEFRVGIHIGDVTIGEIGTIKKDLAMSGDTMNTTARIRSACNELNQKFIVSKEVIDTLDLKEWQSESLGLIELKGKGEGIELFALKI